MAQKKNLIVLLVASALAMGPHSWAAQGCPTLMEMLRRNLPNQGVVTRVYDSLTVNSLQRENLEDERFRELLEPTLPRGRYIGLDYFRQHALSLGLSYQSASEGHDIGLVADFEILRSSSFDPSQVHPRVVEFYEHTNRFRLSVSGEIASSSKIKKLYLKAYARTSNWFASNIGNGRLPLKSEMLEMTSYVSEMEARDGLRPNPMIWARTYREQPALIGLYRPVRYKDRGYVTVLFPYPGGNQLSILQPSNLPDGGLALAPETSSHAFSGDFFSYTNIKGEIVKTKRLTEATQFLRVYVDPSDDELKAEHRFFRPHGNKDQLTLRYVIKKK